MNFNTFFFKNKIFSKNDLSYSLSLISIISPYSIKNINFFLYNFNNNNEKKIYIKQSYLMFTWFYYMNFLNFSKKIKNKVNFFVLPKKSNKFTLTKSPMANKSFSKEQFSFNYYLFKLSFKGQFNFNCINNLNLGLLFVLLSKNFLPNLETNVLFIKNFKFIFKIYDQKYFNFYKFIKI